MHEHGGACGQEIVLTDNRGEVIATPVVNCAPNGARVPEVFAVMSLCSTPCMIDPTSLMLRTPGAWKDNHQCVWTTPGCSIEHALLSHTED